LTGAGVAFRFATDGVQSGVANDDGIRIDLACCVDANQGPITKVAVVGAVAVDHTIATGDGLTQTASRVATIQSRTGVPVITEEVVVTCLTALRLVAGIVRTVVAVGAGRVVRDVLDLVGGLVTDIRGAGDGVAQIRGRARLAGAGSSVTELGSVTERAVIADLGRTRALPLSIALVAGCTFLVVIALDAGSDVRRYAQSSARIAVLDQAGRATWIATDRGARDQLTGSRYTAHLTITEVAVRETGAIAVRHAILADDVGVTSRAYALATRCINCTRIPVITRYGVYRVDTALVSVADVIGADVAVIAKTVHGVVRDLIE
jgi:hypothetical protein